MIVQLSAGQGQNFWRREMGTIRFFSTQPLLRDNAFFGTARTDSLLLFLLIWLHFGIVIAFGFVLSLFTICFNGLGFLRLGYFFRLLVDLLLQLLD